MRSTASAYFFDQDGVLFFHLTRGSIADRNAAPFVFEGPATEAHKKGYAPQYLEYLNENKEGGDPISAPVLEVVPEVAPLALPDPVTETDATPEVVSEVVPEVVVETV